MAPARPQGPRWAGVERSTIEDVATVAGVSVATVSRALRGLPNVATSTRARVEAAARDLDYRPDPHASRLAAGRSRSVAVVVPFINSWYFANLIAGVEAVCADEGYDVLVVTAPRPATRGSRAAGVFAFDRRVDGLIFVEVALQPDDVVDLRRLGLGVVTIGQQTAPFSSVSLDNVAVGRMAVEHLVGLGHSRIGIVAGQAEDPVNFDVPGDRVAGAVQALEHAGVALDPELVVAGRFTVEGGRWAAAALLAQRPLPTALFALSDEMAFGALMAARELGIEIPGDVSLVGVDDHELAAAMGLTTVRQDVVEHGARAAAMLLRGFAGDADGESEHETRPAELVVRHSTQRAAPS
jgi:LacI family transcriptional regulator, repressor for deo operon, udp, cdd, tsx, nupC, and nupG